MKSLATSEFWRSFSKLPDKTQEDARRAYRLWSNDPSHKSLRFKKVGSAWSVRVSRGYRAMGLLTGDTMHWFWIGSHDEYERRLKRRT